MGRNSGDSRSGDLSWDFPADVQLCGCVVPLALRPCAPAAVRSDVVGYVWEGGRGGKTDHQRAAVGLGEGVSAQVNVVSPVSL